MNLTKEINKVLFVLLGFLFTTYTLGQTVGDLVSDAQATHAAQSSGNWSDASTWQGGTVPGNNARVVIPTDIKVTVNSVISNRIKTIRIDGALKFAADVNTELKVETLVSMMGGLLEIGTVSNPIQPNVSARIIFIDHGPINTTWDPLKISRGAVLMGPVRMYGAEKTSWTTLAVQPASGATTLTLETTPVGWEVGDNLIIAGTDPNDHKSDETAQIISINGNVATLNKALTKDHIAPAADLDVHVANTTRNIQISSENTTDIKQRGHIMFMSNLNVDINYVAFRGLGRTNKRISLDDTAFPDLEEDGSFHQGPATNIRGRYSVHFHRGGSDPNNTAATVKGCSVVDDPGWAYVNHSSKVDFIENVSYNIVGGAYQTEAGDETGSFIRNIAIRTVNPDDPMADPKSENALIDIREEWQDFAWQGDGFWIHGGGVAVDSNIVSGASGHAYIYWTEGLIEAGLGMMQFDKSHVPNNNLLPAVLTKLDIWWVPITSSKNNTAYSATKGLVTYYLQTSFLDRDEPSRHVPQEYRNSLNSTFDGFTIWNMRHVTVDFNFTENITVKNTRLVGTGATNLVGLDANHFHNMEDMIFENVTIENFDVGFDVPSNGMVRISNMIMNNKIDFRIREIQKAGGFLGDSDLESEEMPPGAFGRDMRFDNLTFLNSSSTKFQMSPDFTLNAEVQDGIDEANTDKDILYFLFKDKIVLNFGSFREARLYFDQQEADYIPITNSNNSLPETDVVIPSKYVNKTNQQLQNEFGSSFGGDLLPATAVIVPEVIGGKVDGNIITSVEQNEEIPGLFALNQNYPNPFNPSTTISFQIPNRSRVELAVYNTLGEKVATLINQEMSEGSHQVLFNASSLPSGIYFYSLTSGNKIETKKMILLK